MWGVGDTQIQPDGKKFDFYAPKAGGDANTFWFSLAPKC